MALLDERSSVFRSFGLHSHGHPVSVFGVGSREVVYKKREWGKGARVEGGRQVEGGKREEKAGSE